MCIAYSSRVSSLPRTSRARAPPVAAVKSSDVRRGAPEHHTSYATIVSRHVKSAYSKQPEHSQKTSKLGVQFCLRKTLLEFPVSRTLRWDTSGEDVCQAMHAHRVLFSARIAFKIKERLRPCEACDKVQVLNGILNLVEICMQYGDANHSRPATRNAGASFQRALVVRQSQSGSPIVSKAPEAYRRKSREGDGVPRQIQRCRNVTEPSGQKA
jgi:hypothetical protein